MNMMVFILCKITNKSPIFEIFYVRFFYVFIFLGLTMFFMAFFCFFHQILAICLVKNCYKICWLQIFVFILGNLHENLLWQERNL